MKCVIKLSNGNEIACEYSGNTGITEQAISRATFAGGLDRVTITGGAPSEGEEDVRCKDVAKELVTLYPMGKRMCFVLSDAEGASEVERLRSDLDYVAMVSGIEL